MQKYKSKILLSICFIFSAVVALFLSTGFVVSAEPSKPLSTSQIRQAVMQDEKINECAIVVFGNICGVALRTKPLYFKEDLNSMKSGVISRVKAVCDKDYKVLVSCDVDLFLKVSNVEKQLESGKTIFSLKDEIVEILRKYSVRKQ